MSATDTSAVAVKHHPHRQSTLARLTGQPWWTQADQAELDALLGEFINGVFDYHRELCAACVAHKRDHGHYSCKAVAAAWEVVWEFREQRIRVSKAQWLRAINDAGLPT